MAYKCKHPHNRQQKAINNTVSIVLHPTQHPHNRQQKAINIVIFLRKDQDCIYLLHWYRDDNCHRES